MGEALLKEISGFDAEEAGYPAPGDYKVITNDEKKIKRERRARDILDTNMSPAEALYSFCFAIFGQIVTNDAGQVVSDVYRFPVNAHDAINVFRGQERLDDTNSYLVKVKNENGKVLFEDAKKKDLVIKENTKKTISNARAEKTKQVELDVLLSL